MRHALIKDGKVADVILVGWNYQAPEGHHLVASDSANIGDEYDGTTFKRPAVSRGELITHAYRRATEWPFASFRVGGVVVTVDAAEHDALRRFAERARTNKSLSVDWPQSRVGSPGPVTLNAEQLIALDEAVTDAHLVRVRTHAAMLRAIADGRVTTHAQIDKPPASVPSWPPRFYEPAK
jgi:hypothetical protein